MKADAAPDSIAALDLKLKEIVRSLPDEKKPEAIRILKSLNREARSNEE